LSLKGDCQGFVFQWVLRGLKSPDVLGKVNKINEKTSQSTPLPQPQKNPKPTVQPQKRLQEAGDGGLRSEANRCRLKAGSFGRFQKL